MILPVTQTLQIFLKSLFIQLNQPQREKIVEIVTNAATLAEVKFLKYLDPQDGIHSGLQYLKDAVIFNPIKARAMAALPTTSGIPGLQQVSATEFETYRQKSREDVTPIPVVNADGTENMLSIQKEITTIKDFWEANRQLLPTLLSLKNTPTFSLHLHKLSGCFRHTS